MEEVAPQRGVSMPDIVIENANIVDGLGNPGFPGGIGITDGRISEIWRAKVPSFSASSVEIIDAEGQTVCPGFIDIHTHADWGILDYPAAGSSLLMGVTTEVGGNCGTSLAPGSSALMEYLRGLGHDSGDAIPRVGDYLHRVEAAKPGNNQALFVGQGAIRAAVMGNRTDFPDPKEMDLMIEILRGAMREGAFGMSTGRAYVPGCHAGFSEILALTEELGRHRGLYSCHLADQWANIHRAVREVLELGIRCETPVQISHIKVVGKDNWGRMDEVLAQMEDGLDMGVDVAGDLYPYEYSAVAQLRDRLPRSLKDKDDAELLDLLGTDAGADRIRRGWEENPNYATARLPGLGVVWCALTDHMRGKDLGEIATGLKTDLAGAVAHLLIENELRVKVAGIMAAEDLRTALCHPLIAIGSDSTVRDPAEDAEIEPSRSSIHPREYGTFPRVLGRYVRDEGLLTLEEAVFKMTGLPAERLELSERGSIVRGHRADLVVFDPQVIEDRADLDNPAAPPVGISRVFVGGKLAVSEGEMTGQRNGAALRDLQGRTIYG